MRLFVPLLFFFISCSLSHEKIKEIVQANCEGFVHHDNINIQKKESYYIGSILNHPFYSKGYYILVYGEKKTNAIMVVDENNHYSLNDSLFQKIIQVNRLLLEQGKEIEDLYIEGKDSFGIRRRDAVKKYQYKLVVVKHLDQLVTSPYEYK